jgi:uncharacterized protein (UPF0261 family)
MAQAFAQFHRRAKRRRRIIGIGGGGGTSIITAGMRRPALGLPKIMVSTLASGDVVALCRRFRHHHDAIGHRHGRAEPA